MGSQRVSAAVAPATSLGGALSAARREQGWTQEDLVDVLATRLHVYTTQQEISLIESGRTGQPHANLLAALSFVLDVNLFVWVLQPGVCLPA